MKRNFKLSAMLLIGCLFASSASSAQTSFNLGWASEYYFRGIFQQRSSAFVGVDYRNSSIEGNGRVSDVGNGLEARGYIGYNFDVQRNLTVSGGFQGFYYTGDTDESFGEFLVSARYRASGPYSVEAVYSFGEWNGLGNSDEDTEDANDDFFSVTLHSEGGRFRGMYATYGLVGFEFDNDYFQLGYTTRVSGVDFDIAAIFNGIQLTDPDDGGVDDGTFSFSDDEALVLTIEVPF